jgi:hypothetical protein
MAAHLKTTGVVGVDGRHITPKCWVKFVGNASGDQRQIQHGVDAMTDNGTGDYTFGFASTMVNANYGWVAQSHYGGGQNDVSMLQEHDGSTTTTSSIRVTCLNALNAATSFSIEDCELGTIAFYDY